MHTLLSICVFSAIVAVALCGAVVREDDVELMQDTAQAVLKMHKLHQAGLVSEDSVQDLCRKGSTVLTICSQLHIPYASTGCTAAKKTCAIYTPVKHAVETVVHGVQSAGHAIQHVGQSVGHAIKHLFG